MIYVAVGAIFALVSQIVLTANILRQVTRQHAREREQLLARIMHLAGKTWEIPPSREVEAEEEYDSARYSFAPEQEPEA